MLVLKNVKNMVVNVPENVFNFQKDNFYLIYFTPSLDCFAAFVFKLKIFCYNFFMDIKMGPGYDIHKLVEGKKLLIGGIELTEASKGALAHSDGDCLIHAIIDSILGALNLGDIGSHFPDTEVQYKDISSVILLEK